MSKVSNETKYMRGLAKSLNQLAKEVDQMGHFDSESLDLLNKIGSGLLMRSATINLLHHNDTSGKGEKI